LEPEEVNESCYIEVQDIRDGKVFVIFPDKLIRRYANLIGKKSGDKIFINDRYVEIKKIESIYIKRHKEFFKIADKEIDTSSFIQKIDATNMEYLKRELIRLGSEKRKATNKAFEFYNQRFPSLFFLSKTPHADLIELIDFLTRTEDSYNYGIIAKERNFPISSIPHEMVADLSGLYFLFILETREKFPLIDLLKKQFRLLIPQSIIDEASAYIEQLKKDKSTSQLVTLGEKIFVQKMADDEQRKKVTYYEKFLVWIQNHFNVSPIEYSLGEKLTSLLKQKQ
jgi:hypothetical protein